MRKRWSARRALLWAVFALVHLWLAVLCLVANGMPLGDVFLTYKPWAEQAASGYVVGIDSGWVYPIVALVPVMLPLLAGAAGYTLAWLGMAIALNAAAFAVLLARRSPRRIRAAWWWLGFLALLGPIALARLDTLSVALAIIALLGLSARPALAGVLLAVATWIKVWPAVLIAAIVIAAKQRWRVLAAVGATTAAVLAIALVLGAGANVVSFITEQTGRTLQIEAPVSAPWMWAAALGVGGSHIVYDAAINTFEIAGPGVAAAAAAMTTVQAVAAAAVAALGVRATVNRARPAAALPALALSLVSVLIVFNKVGSPQYIGWLAAPVVLGLVCRGRSFQPGAVLVAVTAALTQLFYPYLYDWLLVASPVMVAALTLRNLMLLVVLAWSVADLWSVGGRSATRAAGGRGLGASLGEPRLSAPIDKE